MNIEDELLTLFNIIYFIIGEVMKRSNINYRFFNISMSQYNVKGIFVHWSVSLRNLQNSMI